MRDMDVSQLTRLLEYVPKDTAPDLHQKILGQLVAKKYFQAVYRSDLDFSQRKERGQEFLDGLTSYETVAWLTFTESSVPLSVAEHDA